MSPENGTKEEGEIDAFKDRKKEGRKAV